MPKEKPKVNIGEVIRSYRGQRGLSQGDIERRTGLLRCYLSRVENGHTVLAHIAEGCGVRQTERLVGVHRDTVTRYVRKAGDHARASHDELVAISPPDDRGPVR